MIFLFPAVGGGFKYSVWRTADIQFGLGGSTVSARLPLAYHMKVATLGWPNPTGWTTIGSCGYGQPARGATIGFDSVIEWDTPNWRLRSRTAPYAGEFNPACKVSFLSIDVTDKVEGVVKRQISGAVSKFDSALPRVTNAEPAASQIWSKLQDPIPLGKFGWLIFNPEKVFVSKIDFNPGQARFTTQMTASPAIVRGPPQNHAKIPLPPLEQKNLNSTMNVRLEGYLPFARLEKLVRDRVVGTYQLTDPHFPRRYQLRIVDAHVSGRGETLVLKLSAKGGIWPFDNWGIWGDFYLIGRLRYDPIADIASIDSLRLSAESERQLREKLGHSISSTFADSVGKKLHLKLDGRVPATQRELTKALNVQIDDLASLRATFGLAGSPAIRIDSRGITVFADVTGEVVLDLRPPPIAASSEPTPIVCPD